MAGTERRTIVLHGRRISYLRAGDEIAAGRPVVIFVHGIAGAAAVWQAVLPRLGERYTVIAPDLLGHGESDKPLRHDYSLGAHANGLRDLMIALGIERATIVGHSFGGGVTMQFAYQHPDRCERLVLVSSGGLGAEVSWLLRFMALPGAEYLMPVIFTSYVRTAGNTLRRWLRGVGLRAPRLDEVWSSYTTLTDPSNRAPFIATLRSVVDVTGQTVSAHDRLYLASRLPTLVVWGRHDRIIPVSHAAAAHEALPGSHLRIFDESGHFPQVEEPDNFVAALGDFMDTTAPAHFDVTEWGRLFEPAEPLPAD
jgi:pimeloyl-ACP methyl ester carboxylesterase